MMDLSNIFITKIKLKIYETYSFEYFVNYKLRKKSVKYRLMHQF